MPAESKLAYACVLVSLIGVASSALAQDQGVLNLEDLHNYADQWVPDYINADPDVWKDNTGNNHITDEGATLGRVLFYDKHLSITNTISCASCHQQQYAFSDIEARSQGIDNELTPRHSMRLVNARWGEETRFRWDETAETLEAQMTLPIRKEAEMGYSGQGGNPDFDDLIAKMEGLDYYPRLFRLAFGDPEITEDRMQLAMAQFVRSIQSFDSKYDEGMALTGDHNADFPNFTNAENAGKRLFTDDFAWVADVIEVDGELFDASRRISGGLNCATCHRPPEFDIDPQSLNNGFIRASPPGPNNPPDLVVTRSPTMRDLTNQAGELNGGMFHAGEALNLFGIVAHYDFRQLEDENDNLDPRYTPGDLPQWLDITAQEQNQLFAFMRTLAGSDVYTNVKWSDPFDADGNLRLIEEAGGDEIDLCPADFNGDGTTDSRDVIDFLNAWSAGQLDADMNQDGEIDTRDVVEFLNLFGEGC